MAGYGTFWVRHETGESPEAVQIRVQQMSVVVSRAPLMFVAVAINAMLTAAIGATDENRLVAYGWAGALTVLSLLGFWRWRSRRRSRSPSHVSQRGPRRLARAAAIQGLAWGAGAAWLIPSAASPEQAIIGLTIAAMGAGGAMVLATVPAASIGFTVGCVAPLTIRYLFLEDIFYAMLSVMCVMYVSVLLTMARSVYASFVEMIQARVANDGLLEDLTEARMQLLDAIASTSEGFAQFDSHGRLIVANDRFTQMLGVPQDRAEPGSSFEKLLRLGATPEAFLDDMASYERWIRRMITSQSEGGEDTVEQMPGGRWIGVHHNLTRQGGVVSTLIDITEIKNRETELSGALIRAETADRAKSEFLALMSHELRTPLNAILGFSELFMIEGFGPHSDVRYKTHAGDIHDSGTHLLHIINELLDLSKIEAGFFELSESVIEIGEPISSAVRMMLERASVKGIGLKTEIDSELPRLNGDTRVIKQMLINLLGNSIKFTRHSDDVIIRASLASDGGIRVSVIDRGIGVEAAEIPKIMRPFGQVESSLNRMEQQGTGLGLPLVKQMIELHGGTIDFKSTVGRGTKVTLIFPPERSIKQVSAAE
jgi:signal transduction histidine kinase